LAALAIYLCGQPMDVEICPVPDRLFLSLPGDPGPGPETETVAGAFSALPVPEDLRGAVLQATRYAEAIADGAEVTERVLPDGLVRLGISLSDSGPGAVLIGPTMTPGTVRLSGRMEGITLALSPAAARAIVGMPVRELTETVVPLAEVWGTTGCDLCDQLGDVPGQLAPVWEALRARLAAGQDWLAPAALQGIERAPRPTQSLVRRLDRTERRVQQLFADHLGLAPRSFARLVRWHRLVRSLRGVARPAWAGLALDHGYFDQAHLVRDFRAFSGLTPTEFLRRRISGSSKTGA
jgi:AraC-like DNA-binding protein